MPTPNHIDHCGSFIRPGYLRQARIDRAAGRISDAELRAAEDRAILAVLELQRQVGLAFPSDGEFRRKYWMIALQESLDGVEDMGPDFNRFPRLREKDLKANPDWAHPGPVVVGKVRQTRSLTAHEVAFMQEHAGGPFKITIPSPVTITRAWYRPGVSDRFYPTWDDLFWELVDITRREVADVVTKGVRYIQLDAPGYTRFMVAERREQMVSEGLDPERELQAVIDAENACLRAAKREGVTAAVHICLGTFIGGAPGPTGGLMVNYDPDVMGRLLNELEADTFLIEYTERAGSLESLKLAPKDKTIVLGMLNVRDPQLEDADAVIAKIEEATKYVPLANLALSPNCGFSGAAVDAFMDEEMQRRKLELMRQIAARVWGH